MILACLAASLASCVNDGLGEPRPEGGVKGIATLAEQAASIQATVAEINSVQALLENEDPALEAAISSLESHAASVRTSQDWASGTLATMAQQKKLAAAAGALKAKTDDAAVLSGLKSIEDGAKAWLGKHMTAYYPAAAALAEAEARLAAYGKTLSMWKIQVEGIASDVEAGLKEGIDPKETDAMLASLASVAEASEDLQARLAASVSDVEEGYQKAIATAADDPESFDASALTSLNKAAAADLQDTGVTLQDLIDRVAACESEVAALKDRVSALEGEMGNWEDLLDMIQSVTFMSDFSEEKVVAYYDLNTESEERTEEGYMLRTKTESLELKYVVRPASAAAALAEQTLWNDGLKVFGYYAESLTKAALEMVDYEITDVTADESGIVTLTVKNPLSDNFYFKKTGAKLALSITAGKTDLTSKFVEIVPKDASGTVYAESIDLAATFDMKKDEIKTIKATVNPSEAEQTVTWVSSDPKVVMVEDGTIKALKVGSADITATAVATDEWGRTLTATCKVEVTSNMYIVGPKYVEEGRKINLRLESPHYVDPAKVSWSVPSAATSYVSIEKVPEEDSYGVNQAFVTGLAFYPGENGYNNIDIKCNIEGETELTHTIQAVVVQPRSISVEGFSDDEGHLTLKFGQSKTFVPSVLPADVDMDNFELEYARAGEGGLVNGLGMQSNPTITALNESSLKNGRVSATFTITASPKHNYYYWYDPAVTDKAIPTSRLFGVTVEPYYIKEVSIDSYKNLTLGQSTTLLPTFTSDVVDHAPSYTALTWTSSKTEVVTVDQNGTITASGENTGEATITATVKDAFAVKEGDPIPSVTCVVTVAEATAADPKIGDYFYMDGTFSTEYKQDENNPVIGIVFSLADATSSDSMLASDYPDCIHGLVVSTEEYSTVFGYTSTGSVQANPGEAFLKPNGYDISNTAKFNGYSNTMGWTAYATSKGDTKVDGYYYAEMYRSDVGVIAKHTEKVTPPEGDSSWYIPSYLEMMTLFNQRSVLNERLTIANGDLLSKEGYWMSSFKLNNYGGVLFFTTFDMSEGDWGSDVNDHLKKHPVRVVLAF